jgi:hypothetical protein
MTPDNEQLRSPDSKRRKKLSLNRETMRDLTGSGPQEKALAYPGCSWTLDSETCEPSATCDLSETC